MTLAEATQFVIIDKLKRAIVDNDMLATRALYDSVRFEIKEAKGRTEINIIALDYIVGLDEGVAPAQQPYPTIEAISGWIRAKGLDLNPYAVRNSIISQGTTWYRQGGSNIVKNTVNEAAYNEIVSLASGDMKLKIIEQWRLLFKKHP